MVDELCRLLVGSMLTSFSELQCTSQHLIRRWERSHFLSPMKNEHDGMTMG